MTLTWKRGFCRLRAKGGYDVPSGVGDNRLKVVLVGITVGNPDACRVAWTKGGISFLCVIRGTVSRFQAPVDKRGQRMLQVTENLSQRGLRERETSADK